eukprot:5325083-Karenia_brevis.AAC.1
MLKQGFLHQDIVDHFLEHKDLNLLRSYISQLAKAHEDDLKQHMQSLTANKSLPQRSQQELEEFFDILYGWFVESGGSLGYKALRSRLESSHKVSFANGT